MKFILAALGVALVITGCAQSSVQQMSTDTFLVNVTTAPVCGRSGAGDVAQKIAAIEVLKRGVDRFLIINASTGSEFGGFIGGIPAQRAQTGIVVRIPLPTDPDYDRALSAKQMLGPDWEKQVAKGTPSTC